MTVDNLVTWSSRSSVDDRIEGNMAYPRYNRIMQDLADRFDTSLERATAVFVSLSPNNDYIGNLRSAVTVLDGIKRQYPMERVVISTYGHCKIRAWAYGTGAKLFERETKGLKVLSFYRNILDPTDPAWVTVDGHMSAIWQDRKLTMKEAVVRNVRTYYAIRDAVIEHAPHFDQLPCSLQATLWFTRKRVLRIKYSPQSDLFAPDNDTMRTSIDIKGIRPYPLLPPEVCYTPRLLPEEHNHAAPSDQHWTQLRLTAPGLDW